MPERLLFTSAATFESARRIGQLPDGHRARRLHGHGFLATVRAAVLWGDERATLWRRYRFEAAHRLRNVAPGHKCARMHGHGFEVVLHMNIVPGRRDVALDGEQLDRGWSPLHDEFHRACLNEIP